MSLYHPTRPGVTFASLGVLGPAAVPELAQWLHTWLVSPVHGRKQLLEAAYGAGKPGLNLSNLRDVVVAVPSKVEQDEVHRRMRALLDVADQVDQRVALAADRAEMLGRSVLGEAFSGRLVRTEAHLARAERREYETAFALVERIRRERQRPAERGAETSCVAGGHVARR